MAITLKELKEIREKTQASINLCGEGPVKMRVLVGMATCGIASGARPVFSTLSDLVQSENLTDSITVTRTGCIGLCQYEPVVEVVERGRPKVTYIYMDEEKAREVFEKHLKGGEIIREYTLDASNLRR